MEACRKLGEFIQDLSTWYLRRSRERFKQEKNSPDRLAALTTLYEVLMTVIKLLAPFLPFLSETLYQEMKSITKKSRRTWEKSVHLEDWPREEKTLVDHQLIKEIAVIRQIAELAHSARAESKIKVRQPLSQLVVAEPEFKDMYSNLLAEELNVKEVVKSNLLPMGVEWVVKTEGKIKIALNTMLTDQLKEEGVSREIIRQINHLRKQANLTIKNKIIVYYHSDDPYLEKFLEFFKELVLKETIARSIKPAKEIKTKYKKDISADGKKLIIGIEKI